MLNHSLIDGQYGSIHIVESGLTNHESILFLHGWPEDWREFERIMVLAKEQYHVLSIDLPGIGLSKMDHAPGSKHEIAQLIHELVERKELKHLTIVGHDVGGQVLFSYIQQYPDELKGAVIMNVVVPGIKPWDEVNKNPFIWHFRFHAIPGLPESLVTGKEHIYFDYFFQAIAAHPEKISAEARKAYSDAYSTPESLSTGFNWYRSFPEDVKFNRKITQSTNKIQTPLLYLRGEREAGELGQYIDGFNEAGIVNVRGSLIHDCGHYSPEEQPEEVWRSIEGFVIDI
jgi:pimeloyl-ACP methyl ester carboxylesterase